MRWADLEMKFVRPIKWLIGLLDNVVIDFEIAGVKSGNVSRGHRFLSSGAITINNATEYVEKMAENFGISMRTYQEWRLGSSAPMGIPVVFNMLGMLRDEDIVRLVRKINDGQKGTV